MGRNKKEMAHISSHNTTHNQNLLHSWYNITKGRSKHFLQQQQWDPAIYQELRNFTITRISSMTISMNYTTTSTILYSIL
jgi:hypothetical protein